MSFSISSNIKTEVLSGTRSRKQSAKYLCWPA